MMIGVIGHDKGKLQLTSGGFPPLYHFHVHIPTMIVTRQDELTNAMIAFGIFVIVFDYLHDPIHKNVYIP